MTVGHDPDLMGPGEVRLRARTASTVLRARVLLSSYAALFLILFFRLDPPWARFVCLGLFLIGLGDGIRLTWLAPRGFARPTVSYVRDAGGEIAGYLATYLLPLLAAPDPTGGDLAAYGVYFALVGVVSLRSDLAHVNPTIYVLGWRVVTIRIEADDRERYLICRRAPSVGQCVQVSQLVGVLHEVS